LILARPVQRGLYLCLFSKLNSQRIDEAVGCLAAVSLWVKMQADEVGSGIFSDIDNAIFRQRNMSGQNFKFVNTFYQNSSFYARKLLLSARLSHRNSVRLSVRPSHEWISQKRCKIGLPNLHRRLPVRFTILAGKPGLWSRSHSDCRWTESNADL